MIISQIALKNWRNFRKISNVSIGDRVFLVGPNASGKSNFLDVFRFLRDIAKHGGGLQKAIQDRGGVSKIRCLAARQNPDIEIEVILTDTQNDPITWKYSISIKQEERGRHEPYIGHEKVWKNGNLVLERPDKNDKEDSARLKQTHLEQINANFEFRSIADFFESIHYLHLVPQLVRHPEFFIGPMQANDPYGKSFLERLAKTPDKVRKSRLSKIGDALKLAVPKLKELSFIHDDMGIPHLEAAQFSEFDLKSATNFYC